MLRRKKIDILVRKPSMSRPTRLMMKIQYSKVLSRQITKYNMKFRITKTDFDLLRPFFEGDVVASYKEINLEPVDQTLTQAVYEQEIRNTFYERGYEAGYANGFYKGRNIKDLKEYYCSCGCDGTTCWNRHCGKKCL